MNHSAYMDVRSLPSALFKAGLTSPYLFIRGLYKYILILSILLPPPPQLSLGHPLTLFPPNFMAFLFFFLFSFFLSNTPSLISGEAKSLLSATANTGWLSRELPVFTASLSIGAME